LLLYYIFDSIDQEEILPVENQLISYGYSLDHDKDVYYETTMLRFPLTNIFIDVEGELTFQSNWTTILIEAGAKIVDVLDDRYCKNCDFILCSTEPEKWLRDKAKVFEAPLITVEWVIQTLLSRRPITYDEASKWSSKLSKNHILFW